MDGGRIDAETQGAGGLDGRLGIDLDEQALARDLAAQDRQRADIFAEQDLGIEAAAGVVGVGAQGGRPDADLDLRPVSASSAPRRASGTAKEKPGPSARSAPAASVSSALRKFMGGEPMKPATNLLAGVL